MFGQYFLLPVTIFLIILYVLSYFLYLDGTITKRTYKLIWLAVLILSSLIVSIIGIYMEILVNLQLLPNI